MKKILEENARLFNEANELRGSTEKANPHIDKDWKVFKKKLDERDKQILSWESQHKATIKKLSSDDKLVKAILPYIKDKENDIQREALLVIIESKNKEYILKMVQQTLTLSSIESTIFYSSLGFVSEDAFRVFFEVAEKIGFVQSLNYSNLTKNLISYIYHFELVDLTKKFTKLESFPLYLQEFILYHLSYFEEFKSVILDAYKNRHPAYIDEDGKISKNSSLYIALLFQREEKMALEIMRQKNKLIHDDEVIRHLTMLGNKDDGLIIAEALKEGFISDTWKKQGATYRSRWLYRKLDEAYDVSNPLLIQEMIDIFPEIVKDMQSSDEDIQMYAEELYDIVSTMLGHQFGFPDQKYCDELAKKLSDEKLPVQCWKEHPKKDMRKKFLAGEGDDPYSIYRSLLFTLTRKVSSVLSLPYSRLNFVVMTGKRYPLNETSYYTLLKPQVEKWLDYLDAHKENYKDGRWYRYGRYVDVPYTPIGADSIKKELLPKDFLDKN